MKPIALFFCYFSYVYLIVCVCLLAHIRCLNRKHTIIKGKQRIQAIHEISFFSLSLFLNNNRIGSRFIARQIRSVFIYTVLYTCDGAKKCTSEMTSQFKMGTSERASVWMWCNFRAWTGWCLPFDMTWEAFDCHLWASHLMRIEYNRKRKLATLFPCIVL